MRPGDVDDPCGLLRQPRMRALVAELEERLRWSVQSGKEKGRWRFYFFNGGHLQVPAGLRVLDPGLPGRYLLPPLHGLGPPLP